MKKKWTPEVRLWLILGVGAVVCLVVCIALRRHISELFLVLVLWYSYWYITLKRKHELKKLQELEAQREAEWRAEQERQDTAQDAQPAGASLHRANETETTDHN